MQTISLMHTWLDSQYAQCTRCRQALREDRRADEADLEVIRGNIYDIFRTVLTAAGKQTPDHAAGIRDFFLQKLQTIPSAWSASLEQATAHHDIAKTQIEQLKLDTAREIAAHCTQLWGDAT